MQLLRGYIAGLALALLCVTFVKASQAQEKPFVPGQGLFKLADELRSQGVYERRVILATNFGVVDGYDVLQDLCDEVVVATPIDSRSRPSGNTSIETVYRFRIDERVSGAARGNSERPERQRLPRKSSLPGAPGFRLPSHGEVLVAARGRMLRINGVLFEQMRSYPPFKMGLPIYPLPQALQL